MNTPFFISWRYQRGKKNRLVALISRFSSIGIALGVAVLIIGLSAMNGFERELNQRVLAVVPHVSILPFSPQKMQPIEQSEQLLRTIMQNPSVKAASPFVSFTGLIENGSKLKIVQVQGIDPDQQIKTSSLHQFVPDEQWQTFRHQGGLVLGAGIAQALDVNIGDEVTLLLPQQSAEGKLAQPLRANVSISGILHLGGQLDYSYALLPLTKAQSLLDYSAQQISGVELALHNPFAVGDLTLSELYDYPQPLYIQRWTTKFRYMYDDIHLIRTVMYLAMVLVIGVACFNIISTLIMAVKDKQSDIAILRTLGANNRFIRQIFLWYGLQSGMKGAIFGVLLGAIVSLNLTPLIKAVENFAGIKFLSADIYFIDFLPSELHWLDIGYVLLATLILSLMASLYPAIRATKLEPAKVLSGH